MLSIMIQQLKNSLSNELWKEFQVQRNMLKKDVNKLVDNFFTEMTIRMEASFEDIILKSMAKLASHSKDEEHNDNEIAGAEEEQQQELQEQEEGNKEHDETFVQTNGNAKTVPKKGQLFIIDDDDDEPEILEMNEREHSNGDHSNDHEIEEEEEGGEKEMEMVEEMDQDDMDEDEVLDLQQNHLTVQPKEGNGPIALYYNRKRKIPKMQIDTNAEMASDAMYIKYGLCCPIEGCNEICSHKAELDQHLLLFHGYNPYVCVLRGCSRSFSDASLLFVHQNNAHKDVTNWPCQDCSKECDNWQRLLQHHNTAHSKRIFKCALPQCDYSAPVRRDALRHLQAYHTQLWRQMKAANGAKQFACPYRGCDKVFTERTNLRTHKRFHTRSKPFGCSWPQCKYLSEDRANTIRHIRVRHLKLPATVKEQQEKGIDNGQDPRQWLQIHNDQF